MERIAKDINQVAKHVALYSGVDKKDANAVDNLAADIAVTATQIAEIARASAGNTSSTTVVKNVRRALGYTTP